METVKSVINDPLLFKEARYELLNSLPMNLGSISLGYSNGEPKIYLTKMVGQEGCLDYNIASFISTWKQAIIKREFTPELSSLFQGLTNEFMPGFAYDIGTFHWFLRPHAENTKIGFALFGSRSFNILTKNDPNSLQNLQFFSANLGQLLPLSSFVFRRHTQNLDIGDIVADVFIMVSSTSNIFFQICVKFLFNPEKLTKNLINIMSSTSSRNTNSSFNRINSSSSSKESTQTSSNITDPNSASPDLPQDNDDNAEITSNSNGTNDDNGTKKKKINKDNKERKVYDKNSLLYPGSNLFKWLSSNRFSLLSASVAGLAITAASKGISNDLRVKL